MTSETQVLDRSTDQTGEAISDRLPARSSNGHTPVMANNPMRLLELAADKGATPEQLDLYMDLYERWEKREAQIAFNKSLAAFQAECPIIKRTREVKTNSGAHAYNYAGLDDIAKQIRSLLAKHELNVSYDTESHESHVKAYCRVSKGIHTASSSASVPAPAENKLTNAAQCMGMAISYAKRYALCAALNLVVSDEDDDARTVVEYITSDQIKEINELISKLSAERCDKFSAWLKEGMGAEDLGQLPARHFAKVRDMLKSTVAKKKEETTK